MSEHNIIFIWVPSHLDMPGNEFADRTAGFVRRGPDSDPFCDNFLFKDDYNRCVDTFIRKKSV